jgi:hypothetical protein
MKSKHLPFLVMTMFFIFSLPFLVNAGSTAPWCPPPTTGAPFDGGLSLLIAAGIGYASKKAYDKRKKDKLKEDIGE